MEKLQFTMVDDDLSESLFSSSEDDDTQTEVTDKKDEDTTNEDEDKKKDNTAEVNPNSLFSDIPESVGSEESDNDDEDDAPSNGGTSPEFFSSIATAFMEEGIFPDISEDKIKEVKSAKDFRELISEQIKAELNEQQNRVIKALDNGVPPSEIKKYEYTLQSLSKITEEQLKDENNEALRKRLLYLDFCNRGYSPERAEKTVNKIVDKGDDVDDSIDALDSLKDFYSRGYERLSEEAEKRRKEEEKAEVEKAKNISNAIMKNSIEMFKDLNISDSCKKKAFKFMSEPCYKDEQGNYYTGLQKAELEDDLFQAKVALLYSLTDGFKNLDTLANMKAKKAIRKGLEDLENKINSTSRDSKGNLKFVSGTDSEPLSFLGKGIELAI